MRAFRSILFSVVALGCLFLVSCGTSRNHVAVSAGSSSVSTGKKKPQSHIKVESGLPEQTQALLREADKWLGTAYRYGGNTRAGVDCSGLVCNLFSNALSIKLPRTSYQQGDFCRKISRNELIAGDLVFFRTGKSGKISHVGMYIGDGNIVHASTSRGVIVSSLDESYYRRTYHSSGRVESYYAMISGKKGKKKDKPAPVPQVETPQSYDDVLLAQVGTVAKEQLKDATAGAVKKAVDEASVRLVAATPGEATRAALERTRRKVLDNVIEEKVDSIVSEFFD